MFDEVEIEQKVLLKEEVYKELIKKYENLKYKDIIQTNYYYDDELLSLRKRGLSLRVRYTNKVYTMTLKVPYKRFKKEISAILSKQEFENLTFNNIFPNNRITNFFAANNIDLKNVKYLTNLITYRREFKLDDNQLVCLDKNMYSDMVDYELEVESDSFKNAKNTIKMILNSIGINEFSFNRLGKPVRAILYYQNHR